MTSAITPDSFVQERGEEIRVQLGLDTTPKAIVQSDMAKIFETGVMTNVRVTAERFALALKLSDLGLVATDSKRKDKVMTAIDAVLRSSSRGSLLPKDEMWHEKDGVRYTIPMPEVTERKVRMLFPTRYDEGGNKSIANPSFSSWLSIPLNGATFIPFSTWKKWNEEYEKARITHLDAAQIIVENYDRLKSSSVAHYSQIALDVYNRLKKTAPEQISRQVLGDNGEYSEQIIPPLEWVRRWQKVVMRAWPSKDDIIRKYTVEAKFYWAPKPERVKADETMRKMWHEDEDAWKIMVERDELRNRIMELEDDVDEFGEMAQERLALRSIAKRVEQTRQSQSHELTVAYVKAIVERSESVFINCLGLMRDDENSLSAMQLNSMLKVSEMIKTLSFGVKDLETIRVQAERVESYINENFSGLSEGQKSKKKVISESMPELPGIIASAVNIIRMQAESLIGHEARRTHYSDQDTAEILQDIVAVRSGGQERVSRVTKSDDDEAEALDSQVLLTYALPVPFEDEEDDMAVVRRSR